MRARWLFRILTLSPAHSSTKVSLWIWNVPACRDECPAGRTHLIIMRRGMNGSLILAVRLQAGSTGELARLPPGPLCSNMFGVVGAPVSDAARRAPAAARVIGGSLISVTAILAGFRDRHGWLMNAQLIEHTA